MRNARINALVLAVFIMPSASAAQQAAESAGQTFTLSGEMLRDYQNLQRDLAEMCEQFDTKL
jgi:hypothetical protein